MTAPTDARRPARRKASIRGVFCGEISRRVSPTALMTTVFLTPARFTPRVAGNQASGLIRNHPETPGIERSCAAKVGSGGRLFAAETDTSVPQAEVVSQWLPKFY